MNVIVFIRRNWFLLGLLAAVSFGFATPGFGNTLNPDGQTTRAVVVVLFLIAGFILPSERIRSGLAQYKLHVFLQLFIFVFIPAYFWLTARFFTGYLDGLLVYGMFALAVLPTTVSTCVVFTQTTGGNTVGALFNSALSNVVGIFLSPLLLSLFLAGSPAALPAENILGTLQSLVLTMFVPVAIGQGLHLRFRETAQRIRKKLSEASSALILFIVYVTISGISDNLEFLDMLPALPVPFLFLAVTHLFFVAVAYFGAQALGLPRNDRISAMFVGPEKTMAMGVPLLTVYFTGRPDLLAIALLPLLFYHPFQLLTGGIIRSLPAFRPAPDAESHV